ncbi:MAG: ATP-dependent protease subunit HslV [Candidatus Marinimicrobia bacterium]|nr:ATP-dependent protease subunit HslV [Candidatus Neomarinimicrobiota bacterium]
MSFKGTTVLSVRKGKNVVMGGDGQVTVGQTVMKTNARKVRRIHHGAVLAGFAGATADAFTLFEKFEEKLDEFSGNLMRASVELAKEWRTDKYLRELDALLALMDRKNSYILSGTGDVIDPEGGVISIGSGSGYALAAARALILAGRKEPHDVVDSALKITADICIYSNNQITILDLE